MYGFAYNEAKDNFVVVEEKIGNVRRIFREVGVEGRTINAVKVALDREEVPTPSGVEYWSKKTIRDVILDDAYKPHDADGISSLVAEGLLSAEVASRLDPKKRYGVWWFNRWRVGRTQTSEPGPDGTVYRRRVASKEKPREERVPVPIPDAGIPGGWVDAAREATKDNRPISGAAQRLWSLSGGVFLCGECGRRMHPNGGVGRNGRTYVYHRCPKRITHGPEACAHRKQYRAERVEAAVWELVSGILEQPSRLRAALAETIERERRALSGDPDREVRTWLGRLAEADRKRSRYQEMAAEGLIDFDELRAKLASLEKTRETARRELEALEGCRERLAQLERDRDSLMERYAALVPEALEALDAEERHLLYVMLRIRMTTRDDDTIEMTGALTDGLEFGKSEPTWTCRVPELPSVPSWPFAPCWPILPNAQQQAAERMDAVLG
jgi:site-specific DNA recombinase